MKNKLKLVSQASTITRRCIAKGVDTFINHNDSMKLRRRAVYRNWLGWFITFLRRKVDWLALGLITLAAAASWLIVKYDLL